jgi:hypothetical protein
MCVERGMRRCLFIAGGFGDFDDDGELDLASGDFETLG